MTDQPYQPPQPQQPAQPFTQQPAAEPQPVQPVQPAQPYTQQPYTPPTYAQPQADPYAQPQADPYAQQPYGQQAYAQPTYAQPTYDAAAIYPMTESDRTMRLIAFIFCIIAMVSVCWAIIPLAWMIPMSIHCWGIYKGTKRNTVAFGVCTLIFLSLVAGILLLVSSKDE